MGRVKMIRISLQLCYEETTNGKDFSARPPGYFSSFGVSRPSMSQQAESGVLKYWLNTLLMDLHEALHITHTH